MKQEKEDNLAVLRDEVKRLRTALESKGNKMTYKILFDYRSDGHSFFDAEFKTVDDAVKTALDLNYSAPFLIVSVIDWTASEAKAALEGEENQ